MTREEALKDISQLWELVIHLEGKLPSNYKPEDLNRYKDILTRLDSYIYNQRGIE